MPDFELRITSTASPTVWEDPEDGGNPSRINPDPAHPYLYLRVTPPSHVVVEATVNGVEGPLDGALDGRLFQVHFAEWSGFYPPPITQPSGQTSVAEFDVTDEHLGHFVIVFRRPSGGAVLLHFDVET
jgi:hypothetical protein